MKKIRFAYNEPRLGSIEIDRPIEAGDGRNSLQEEDILRMIEEEFPEAIDIEIVEFEELDG